MARPYQTNQKNKRSKKKSKKINQKVLQKWNFPALLKQLYEESFKPEHLQSGFRATGLYPLDKTKIRLRETRISKKM